MTRGHITATQPCLHANSVQSLTVKTLPEWVVWRVFGGVAQQRVQVLGMEAADVHFILLLTVDEQNHAGLQRAADL